MPARRLAAGWVLPIEQPPIERGAVLIGPDGRLDFVGPDQRVPRPVDVPAEEHPDAVLLPGLINTHTHLELTGLAGRVQEREFTAWIRRLRELKTARPPEEYLDDARRGIGDSWAMGVTTVADTGDSGAVIRALAELGGSGVAYHEVFGPHPDQLASSLGGLKRRVEELAAHAAGRVRLGVSPHAPYTVSGPLYAAAAAWARAEGFPLATHVAESRAESELLLEGVGPFAEDRRARGIPLPAPLGLTPVSWLERHGVLGADTLCIHAVRVSSDDIARLQSHRAAIAHCPLSNRAHGNDAAPLARFRAAGLRVGVGTDSVVSVGPLDLLAEARAARALADLTAEQALELATLEGARALGLDGDIGSLRSGKWGDCVVIRPAGRSDDAPAERVLASGPADVRMTCVGGRVVFRRGG